MMRGWVLTASLAALTLTACAPRTEVATVTSTAPEPGPNAVGSLDQLARNYVALSLEIGTHEDGYIDAYYGPAELRTKAERAPRDKASLRRQVAEMLGMTHNLARRGDGFATAPARVSRKQLIAADTRLQMMDGTRFKFADEAERLFAVRPTIKPLGAYDAGLAEIAGLIPGDGPLAARVDAYLEHFVIPKDKLLPVFNEAIAACRARTAQHIAMPATERFTLEFVTGKPWSGYNYYKGDFKSLIQINTDLPIRLSRAVDLGCHEGYPGHHALNFLLEQRLTRERGWTEYSVYPLYSPQSLIAEGTANHGIEMAFPGPRKEEYERRVLMPLAGISAPADSKYWRLLDAIKQVSGARITIAQMYLDGEIDRARAVALTQQYLLMSPARAEQSVKFTETYRSYVINYGLGQDMVAADIAREGDDVARQWKRFEALISEPTLPSDLRR
ncbi:MAG: hypothetical protein HC788_07655 [Sphingopyxis sp.]|nr:hypothetical protein [Sphingopyxis sp.]